jgi:hypothetical protein
MESTQRNARSSTTDFSENGGLRGFIAERRSHALRPGAALVLDMFGFDPRKLPE